MGNTRQWTTKFNANNDTIEAGLKAKGYRSPKKRRELMMLAAMGRPANLPEQARAAVALRRSLGRKEETRS